MIPMPPPNAQLSLAQLSQLAERFTHWRQNRPSPKARIPQALGDQAVALTLSTNLSVSRIAKELGLCSTDLKKRCPSLMSLAARDSAEPPVQFVELTSSAPWSPPMAEVDLRRPDGAHLHLTYPVDAPGLADLIHAFLERG